MWPFEYRDQIYIQIAISFRRYKYNCDSIGSVKNCVPIRAKIYHKMCACEELICKIGFQQSLTNNVDFEFYAIWLNVFSDSSFVLWNAVGPKSEWNFYIKSKDGIVQQLRDLLIIYIQPSCIILVCDIGCCYWERSTNMFGLAIRLSRTLQKDFGRKSFSFDTDCDLERCRVCMCLLI